MASTSATGWTVSPYGQLYDPKRYPDVKDPSPVRLGKRWHLFGTGCGLDHGLEISHATAPKLAGPWREEPAVQLVGVQDTIPHPSAPGVIADGTRLHMFLQHDFNVLGGAIEHLVSDDEGMTFIRVDTALQSIPGSAEAGVYDPDPAVVDGQRYLSYAAMSVVGQPELFLARSVSGSWDGPWERLGCVLDHHAVEGHNQIDDEDYEWGLEGPHLLELPDGRCLLTAVCFLAAHPRGSRQRILLAVAETPIGPYESLGAFIEPAGDNGSGENGHGTAVRLGNKVELIYQERSGDGKPWRFMRAGLGIAAEPSLLDLTAS